MKSKRADGKGHWRKDRPRSTLTDAQAAEVRARINRALAGSTYRAVAIRVGISTHGLWKVANGFNRATERTAAKILGALP